MPSSLHRENSVDSNCSLLSVGFVSQLSRSESISDLSDNVCKCDDCLLGITDALADLVLWNSSNNISYNTTPGKPETGSQEKTIVSG